MQKEEVVTIDREIDEDGNLPQGREIVPDPDHPIEVPPEFQGMEFNPPEGDENGHGREL